ncbi:MAG TPA: hypothetical protein VMV72_14610 [Verrucomicrobiae bacterium]|nr:hypothetical protein [Verrucomicrobiae bacterium]
MHSILFIVEAKPDLSERQAADWVFQLDRIDKLAGLPDKAMRLHPGAYLLRGSDGLPALANLIRQAQDSHFSYRVLFFDKDPQWLCSPKTAVTTA